MINIKFSILFSIIMNTVLSTYSASISDLKKQPSRLIEEADGEAIAILNHNKPTAYLVPAEVYERMIEELENRELAQIIAEREAEKQHAVAVSLNEL